MNDLTYRYYNIRREICNDNLKKEFNKLRTFSEMKKLFTPFHWVIFIGVIFTICVSIILSLFISNKLLISIPLCVLIVLLNIWELCAEKLYNNDVRKKELRNLNKGYEKYLKKIYEIFKSNGITNKEQLAFLKKECQSVFIKRENKFKILNNKIFEIFIGIPIGTLISTNMFENTYKISKQIVAALFIGMIIYMIISAIKFISYYTDGLWKDQRLFDAINEMEFYFSI